MHHNFKNLLALTIGCNDIGREDLNRFDSTSLKTGRDWKQILADRSEIMNTALNLRRNFLARKMKLVHHSKGVDALALPQIDSIDYAAINRMITSHERFLKPFESRIKDLIEISKTNDIIPVFVTQPSLVGNAIDEVTQVDLGKIQYCEDLGGIAFWKILELYNDVTRKVASENNIHLIDLAVLMPKSTTLFYDCIHFTNQGAEVVSEIIYNDLKKYLQE